MAGRMAGSASVIRSYYVCQTRSRYIYKTDGFICKKQAGDIN